MGLIVAAALVGAAALAAVALPSAPAPADAPAHITRLFMPAIKAECRLRAGIPDDVRIGYRFTRAGALITIDRTGAFTGLDIATLRAFNSCLARYPIQPAAELPRDRYGRHLLYDYYLLGLRPCLAARTGDVPPLPSRSDFVVRLYQWDPYRRIALRHPLAELLALEAACPALPPYLTG